MILHGDALEVLRTLPDRSVQCCVTSPPYFGLRDYGTATWLGGDPTCDHRKVEVGYRGVCGKCDAIRVDQQLGIEATPAEYVANMVIVFREVRRVLRDDGTCWINMGDTYASSWPCRRRNQMGNGSLDSGKRENRPPRMADYLKEKDLIGIPWLLAFALRDDGWYLRSDIVWHKNAVLPESVKDRPTNSYEHVFLLAKSARYFYDQAAIREPCVGNGHGRSQPSHKKQDRLLQNTGGHLGLVYDTNKGRNARNVWTINPRPFPGSHFATMPPALAERCILAATSAKGCCAKCGAPWVRATCGTIGHSWRDPEADIAVQGHRKRSGQKTWDAYQPPVTIGWQPSCDCEAEVVPCLVLDPFGGAGTTGLAAQNLGRDYILIELKAEYVRMATRRMAANNMVLGSA